MREKFEVRNLQQSTFCGKKYAAVCVVSLQFLCCVCWEAPSDRCSCLAALTAFPVSTACFWSASTGVWQDQRMHPTNSTPGLCRCTWPRRWGRRAAITLSRPPAGSCGVNASPLALRRQHAALASRRTPILSLARVEALHHSSVLLYSPAVSCRICLHRGLLKSPGKDESKNRTGPVSPVSRKLPQTSLFH